MTTLSVIVGGVETQLASVAPLVGHVGWGLPVLDSYSSRSPGQHGDTWGGFSLAPRIGALNFKMDKSDLDLMYTLRSQLLTLFHPSSPIILKFVTLEGSRCFACRTYDDLRLDWSVNDWAAQPFTVILKASDPSCYDPIGVGWTFSLGGGADAFVVPYEVPYKLGASVIDQSQIVTYPGTWNSYPLLRITGPIEDPVITNLATGEVISFDGTHIAGGDYYDIDCRYGLKTVTDAAGVNQLHHITSTSDLSTFHIAAHPEVTDGINPIHVVGTGVTAVSKVDLSYFVRYLGV